MKEFIALKPKAYTYTTTENDQVCNNTLKGVPKHIRNSLNLETYKECLYANTRISKDIFNLSSIIRIIMSLTKNSKITLSYFEDKRYYADNLHSYEYGHPKITNDSSDNKGGHSFPEERDKSKRSQDETEGLRQKKKKLGMIIIE